MEPVSFKHSCAPTNSNAPKRSKRLAHSLREEEITSVATLSLSEIPWATKPLDNIPDHASPVSVTGFSLEKSSSTRVTLNGNQHSTLKKILFNRRKFNQDFGASIKWFQTSLPPLKFK